MVADLPFVLGIWLLTQPTFSTPRCTLVWAVNPNVPQRVEGEGKSWRRGRELGDLVVSMNNEGVRAAWS